MRIRGEEDDEEMVERDVFNLYLIRQVERNTDFPLRLNPLQHREEREIS